MDFYNIVFVGDMNVYAREYALVEVLQQLGHRVTVFTHTPVQNSKLGYTKAKLLTRFLWKIGFQLDTQHAAAKVSNFVRHEKPDVVWIVKGNMINPFVLKQLKKHHPNLMLISSAYDDMYAWHNRTWFYTFGLKYYDLVFTTKSYNCHVNELPKLGAKRVCFIPHAYNLGYHYPIQLSDEELHYYGAAVSFIGCYEEDRAQSLLYLAQHGVPVRVWGNGWKRFRCVHPNMHIEYRPVVNHVDDFSYTKTICASDINLCFLRKMNRDLHTSRSIEIVACGGFMLAERTVDHSNLFKDGKEVVFFESNEELLQLVKYYLAHPDERRAIAVAGRQRCLKDDYSNCGRLKLMLKEIDKLKSKN